MRIVPWPVQISETEKRPLDEVMAGFAPEASGILNWLIAGALEYLSRGLVVPPEVKDATEDYREEMDPIGGFIRDCVTHYSPPPEGAEPRRVTAHEMYEAFVAWYLAHSVRPWKEKYFAASMTQKGFVKGRSKTVRRYNNVSLHDVPARNSRRDELSDSADDDVVPL